MCCHDAVQTHDGSIILFIVGPRLLCREPFPCAGIEDTQNRVWLQPVLCQIDNKPIYYNTILFPN